MYLAILRLSFFIRYFSRSSANPVFFFLHLKQGIRQISYLGKDVFMHKFILEVLQGQKTFASEAKRTKRSLIVLFVGCGFRIHFIFHDRQPDRICTDLP